MEVLKFSEIAKTSTHGIDFITVNYVNVYASNEILEINY
jgi:hypothetical protein